MPQVIVMLASDRRLAQYDPIRVLPDGVNPGTAIGPPNHAIVTIPDATIEELAWLEQPEVSVVTTDPTITKDRAYSLDITMLPDDPPDQIRSKILSGSVAITNQLLREAMRHKTTLLTVADGG